MEDEYESVDESESTLRDLERRIEELEAELDGAQAGGGFVFFVSIAGLVVGCVALWRTF